MNFEEILSFTFAWAKSGKSLKYYLVLFLVPIILLAVLAVLALSSLGPVIASATQNPLSVYSPAFFGQAFGALLSFFALFFLWALLYILIEVFLNAWVNVYALRAKNLPVVQLSFGKFLGLIVLHIMQFLSLFFFPAGKRTRMIVWACIALLILSFLVPLLFLLGLIYVPLYLAAVIYSTFRISMSTSIFLSKGTDAWRAIQESWALTHGKVLHILVAMILIGIAAVVVGLVLNTLLSLLFTQLISPMTANLNLGMTAAYINNILAQTLAGFFYGPVVTLMGAFGVAALYAELARK